MYLVQWIPDVQHFEVHRAAKVQRLVRMLGPLDRKVQGQGEVHRPIQFQAILSKDMSLGPQVLAKGEGLVKMIGML